MGPYNFTDFIARNPPRYNRDPLMALAGREREQSL